MCRFSPFFFFFFTGDQMFIFQVLCFWTDGSSTVFQVRQEPKIQEHWVQLISHDLFLGDKHCFSVFPVGSRLWVETDELHYRSGWLLLISPSYYWFTAGVLMGSMVSSLALGRANLLHPWGVKTLLSRVQSEGKTVHSCKHFYWKGWLIKAGCCVWKSQLLQRRKWS